jgi:hypothetical protein
MEKFKKVFDIISWRYSIFTVYTTRPYHWRQMLIHDIADVYETYFIANIYSYEEGNEFDKYFKFDYSKVDDAVTVNLESKAEVFLKRNWEEVVPDEVQTQLNEKETKIELQTQLMKFLKTEEEAIETKFNESTEKLTQLNSLVEELKPFKEQVETANFEKALNEKKEFYSKKFSALNAVEKFESEEVQGLVEKAVYENEEGKNAILQLNSLLVELVEVPATPVSENPTIREFSSKRENLIPASEDFESRYSL